MNQLLITYCAVLGVALCSSCSLQHEESPASDPFNPEATSEVVRELSRKTLKDQESEKRKAAKTHQRLKKRWGDQLVGEWHCVDMGPGKPPPKSDWSLAFCADDSARMISAHEGKQRVMNGIYEIKDETSEGSVFVMIKWVLTEEERKDPFAVDILPLVLRNGTNIFLQVKSTPGFIKSIK